MLVGILCLYVVEIGMILNVMLAGVWRTFIMSGEMIDVREGTGLCDVFNIDVLHIINDVYAPTS